MKGLFPSIYLSLQIYKTLYLVARLSIRNQMRGGKNFYSFAGQGIYKNLIEDQDKLYQRVIHIDGECQWDSMILIPLLYYNLECCHKNMLIYQYRYSCLRLEKHTNKFRIVYKYHSYWNLFLGKRVGCRCINYLWLSSQYIKDYCWYNKMIEFANYYNQYIHSKWDVYIFYR